MQRLQPENAAKRNDRNFVSSIERAFAVVRSFDASSPELSLSEVAARTGLDRATARRYLLTLEQLGYVARHDRYFTLRPRILELGYAYLSSLDLTGIAQPILARLVERSGESSAVTVLDGDEVVYVAVANAERRLAIRLTVGNRLPAYCTAMGRVLYSGLDDSELEQILQSHSYAPQTDKTVYQPSELLEIVKHVREQGYAIVDQEMVLGVRSVAVPLFGKDEHVTAAVSISSPAARVKISELRGSLLEAARWAAQEMHANLVATPMA
ncbi:MAG: helix-turn-helix domain-containing protein [Actinobacteria bacterium]|jgi:IclR family pca regulon transcriptional regulator|nr:helix-turn-helix domain-containing protein [Actinomycetota bacterium]